MLFSNRSPNSSHHRIDVERQMSIEMRVRSSVAVAVAIPVSIPIGRMPICRVARFHFSGDYQAFFVCHFDREDRATSGPYRGMALLHSLFNFLRIQIAATDDNQILQPAGDIQLAVSKESQISGPQKRPFARTCQEGTEGDLRFLRPVPVAL